MPVTVADGKITRPRRSAGMGIDSVKPGAVNPVHRIDYKDLEDP
jgi:hypothetical protein